jgi:predicted TIM-barrel fold metal-dependent hydrolase
VGSKFADHLVIDVDGHTFEPDELWEQYLPASFHDQRPRLIRDERNTTRYVLEGRVIPPGTGRGAWVPEGMRESSVHREGAVDPKLRLEDMDTEGIDIAVLYGVVSLGFYQMSDRALANAVCRAYNDWLADYCAADPNRLKGTPALPLKWIDDACAEAERTVRDLGFVSLTVPCAVGERNADHPDNDPLYALAEELDVPVGFHAGGGRFAHSKFVDSYAQLHALEFPFNIMFAMTTVVCGGVLERFPRLRVSLLEAGVGWAPYFVERLDEHYEHRPHEMPNITKAPSEYLAEGRLFISTEGEEGLPHASAALGGECVVWASDYPHWDSDFPNGVSKVMTRDDLDADQKRALFETNAKRLYGWS